MGVSDSGTLHHTCFVVNDIEATVKALADSLASGNLGEFCYFDISKTGTVLELLYLKELPPPEKTIG